MENSSSDLYRFGKNLQYLRQNALDTGIEMLSEDEVLEEVKSRRIGHSIERTINMRGFVSLLALFGSQLY